jgi:hypothetical protein
MRTMTLCHRPEMYPESGAPAPLPECTLKGVAGEVSDESNKLDMQYDRGQETVYTHTKLVRFGISLLLATCTKSAPCPVLWKTTTPPSPTTPLATRNMLSSPPNCIPRTCFSPVKNWLMILRFPFASRVRTAIESPLGSSFGPILRFEA